MPVQTNKPGDRPIFRAPIPDGQEAIAKIKVNAAYDAATGQWKAPEPVVSVNLFADEKQFPELANPVQMAWDTKGRLWVAAWKNYPEREPTSTTATSCSSSKTPMRDGKADKCTTFLDDLNAPTGFTFYKDGVLLMQAPDLWFVPVTPTATGKGDWKERVIMGIDSADSHHTTNAMCLDPSWRDLPERRRLSSHSARNRRGPAAAQRRDHLALRAAHRKG